MLFAEDSHVKTCRSQGKRKELPKAKDRAYTPKCSALLASVCHDTQSLKTSQVCLLENQEDGLLSFSMTWPRSGMMRNGIVSQLQNLARPITEIGSGLLPTPNARDYKDVSLKGSTYSASRNRHTPSLATESYLLGLTGKQTASVYCWAMGYPPGWHVEQ